MIPLIFLAIIVCWVIGGQKGGRIRDVACPILLGLGVYLALKEYWLISRIIYGILTCGSANAIRAGYGNWEPGEKNCLLANILAFFGYKDRQGAVIRALWGFLIGVLAPLPLVLGHFLPLPIYYGYVAGNMLINFLVSRLRLPVLLTDICVSASIASLIFLLCIS